MPVSAILPVCDEQTETKAQQNPKKQQSVCAVLGVTKRVFQCQTTLCRLTV